MASLNKPLLITGVVVAAAIATFWFWPATKQATAPAGRPMNPWAMPVPVRVVTAQPADLRVQVKTIGTVTPLNTVVVQSRVSGPLQQLLFKTKSINFRIETRIESRNPSRKSNSDRFRSIQIDSDRFRSII